MLGCQKQSGDWDKLVAMNKIVVSLWMVKTHPLLIANLLSIIIAIIHQLFSNFTDIWVFCYWQLSSLLYPIKAKLVFLSFCLVDQESQTRCQKVQSKLNQVTTVHYILLAFFSAVAPHVFQTNFCFWQVLLWKSLHSSS